MNPLLNRGVPSNINNNPPIVLRCSISKDPEKDLFNAIYIHVLAIFSLNQFGFVKGPACLQQILITPMLTCINSRDHTTIDVIYLDFWMGLDSVSHEDLQIILWNTGITGSFGILLKNYETNSCQLTSIDDLS